MVSYYNPTAVAMFTSNGRSHYPHHHSHHHSPPVPTQPYFPPAAYSYPHGPHPHQQSTTGGSPLGVGVGVPPGIGISSPLTSTQFSPNMATELNHHGPYHPHSHHQFGVGEGWHHHQNTFQYNASASACAARTAAAAQAALGYEDWNMHHHPSFYHHAAPSPPSSSSSPISTQHQNQLGSNMLPSSPHVFSTSANANNSASTPTNSSNSGNGTPTFKTEFGPCSTGNNQESQDMTNNGQLVSSAATPHSPDSGMAISDGVSSSGSPATAGGSNATLLQQYPVNGSTQGQQCLGGPASSGAGSSASMSSSSSSENPLSLHHPHHLSHHQGSPHYNLSTSHHHMTLQQQGTGQGQHSPLINVSNGRPTQARSPYEWMKKPTYTAVATSSTNNAKTRTKDKYRVVYSDTQRLELEKEFHYSRYITIRRKSELAVNLGLSERQVKIWFQNRRAKERKIHRKKDEIVVREKSMMIHMQGMPQMMCGNPMNNQSLSLM